MNKINEVKMKRKKTEIEPSILDLPEINRRQNDFKNTVLLSKDNIFELLEQQQKVLVSMSKQLDSISSVLQTMAKIMSKQR